MTPLKFRAWDGKRMYSLLGIEFAGVDNPQIVGAKIAPLKGEEYVPTEADAGDLVVLQFTGIIDKNGKEVYVGDILRHEFPLGIDGISVVRWTTEIEDNHPGFRLYSLTTQGGPFEVIGNIYENPSFQEETPVV